MSNPTVSVIVTSYNRADYLREAVDSIIGQSFKDFEIIIVDDGSTDNAPQVAAEYANQYDFISFITQENAGVATARNTGVAKARGEFITFQDDDDISHSLRLEKQIAIMQSHHDIAACNCNFSHLGKMKAASQQKENEWNLIGVNSSMMLRKEIYLSLGGQRPYFVTSEDSDFYLRFKDKYQCFYLDEVLYYYRQYHISSNSNLTYHLPLNFFAYDIAKLISYFCRKNKQPDPIDSNIPLEKLMPRMSELPLKIRQARIKHIRNIGRRILSYSVNKHRDMTQAMQYLHWLSCPQTIKQAQKARRWLIFQSLRHGEFRIIKLLLNDTR